jgi:hypothetical protein
VIHISAAGDHTDLPVMFAGFMVVAVLQIGLGALLISRPPSRLVIAAAIAMTVSSIGLWVLSRTTGIPFIPGGHQEPVGFKDGVTKLFEIASIPALLLMLSKDLARVSVPPRLGTRAITVLGTACLALLPPALLLGGHTHPSHDQAMAMGIHDAHGKATELAHNGSGAGHAHGGADATEPAHHAHGGAAHDSGTPAAAGHDHSDVVLASAPLGSAHHHSETQTPSHSPTHHSGDSDNAAHHHRKHGDRPHDEHHGSGHGGGHGHGDHGEDPGSEDAITVSYAPEPSVCVTGICFP